MIQKIKKHLSSLLWQPSCWAPLSQERMKPGPGRFLLTTFSFLLAKTLERSPGFALYKRKETTDSGGQWSREELGAMGRWRVGHSEQDLIETVLEEGSQAGHSHTHPTLPCAPCPPPTILHVLNILP